MISARAYHHLKKTKKEEKQTNKTKKMLILRDNLTLVSETDRAFNCAASVSKNSFAFPANPNPSFPFFFFSFFFSFLLLRRRLFVSSLWILLLLLLLPCRFIFSSSSFLLRFASLRFPSLFVLIRHVFPQQRARLPHPSIPRRGEI